jgi:hypothetical protein
MEIYLMRKNKKQHYLNYLKQRMKVFENDINQLYKRKNNEIFEYTGRHILNDDSIIVDDSSYILQFYVNVVDENNNHSLLIDKLSNTYSIEKDVVLLTIDRNIFDSDLDVFQFSFIIFNLKNDSQVETGIRETDSKNLKSKSFLIKSLDIKGTLLKHDDIYNK